MADPWDTLKLLADPTRLRILNLLQVDELSVAELQEILDMGQSRISSHLALLRGGGLVSDRKEGKKSIYQLRSDLALEDRALVEASCRSIRSTDLANSDQANLQRIIHRRRQIQEAYFNSVAGRLGKNYCPGRSWEAVGHFLLHLVPEIDIVDLGAGEGLISQMLARRARRVVCVDQSAKMVEFGEELAQKNGFTNLTYIRGDIEAVPLEADSFDMALLSQALHHAEKPALALAEAYRILKPGGRLVVIDLLQHDFEKARELYADRWLGFSENELYNLLQEAGFKSVEVNRVAREEQEPYFETLLGSGTRG